RRVFFRSRFMARCWTPGARCRTTVNRHVMERMANGLPACSTATGAYCKARQRLPKTMVHALLRHTGAALLRREPAAWKWHGRPVKLIDGSTVTMPDTAENQARYPQLRTQKPGLGFAIARVVVLLSLGSGGVLDAAMGPCKGKGASEQ